MKKFQTGLWCVLVLSLTLTGTDLNAQVSRGAKVPFEAIPEELKGLDIKDHFVPTPTKKVGVIHALVGNVVVVHRATREAFFGKAGDTIYENDSLTTLTNARCRIRFFDEDVVTMAPETQFSVDQFQDQRTVGKKSSLFSLLKGKAMFYAMRLFRYRESRFRLKTPTVTVGVRGTKFGVHVYSLEEEKRGDAGVRVADRDKGIGRMYLAQVGPGGGETVTVVAAGDGDVVANGNRVRPGEVYDSSTQEVTYDPGKLDEIESDAEVKSAEQRAEEEERKAEEEVEEELAADTGEELAQAIAADQTENVTDTTSIQQGSETASEAELVTQERPTKHLGYFSAILTDTTSSAFVEDVFVSTSRQDFDSASVQAEGVVTPLNILEGSDTFGGESFLTKITIDPNDSGDLGTTRPISDAELGFNSYQEWGEWTMPTDVTVGSFNYAVDNEAYYMIGENTPDAAISGFSGTATYSGDAFGTYWVDVGSDPRGTEMDGSFSSSVNFDSAQITNFTMTVWENESTKSGKHAFIKNGTGSFGSSHFEITSATWELFNGSVTFSAPPYKKAVGSLYGPNGEHIGGAWGIKEDSSNAAAGIFQGDKQ